MTICFLTPTGRWEQYRPPIYRPFKKPVIDGHTLSVNQFNQLPADKKAGFLFLPKENIYIRKFNAVDFALRHEVALRLVEASKSPTEKNDVVSREISKQKFLNDAFLLRGVDKKTGEVLPIAKESKTSEFELGKIITPHETTGTATVIQFREWAEEWRVRTQVDVTSGNLPPAQSGERISELLSDRGAKKIAESCEYMGLKKGGFKTFVTGTFSEEARKKIKSGETTIQREVSRCMDAMQKMYQRGWNANGETVPGHNDGLAYCWVVEVPLNENGEENPHVHMLLGWRVRYRHFDAWSKRIEKIWGNGYFHLEKIKDCMCAGAYMAKAAGYMTKVNDEAQGRVRGNRYGISDSARAPDWVTISKSQLHSMGQIIADVYDHLTIKYGDKYRLRKQLNEALSVTPKDAKVTRQKIGEKLQKVREELKKIPVRCNKYQLILKGKNAALTFLWWAKGQSTERPEWLPELPKELAWQEGRAPVPGDSHYFAILRKKFQWLKRCRHAFTNEMCAALVERWQEFRDETLSMWESYNLDLCQ